MNFIKIIDNTGDLYYINPTSIAYLKSNEPTPTNNYPNKQVRLNKVVLKNDKQILVPSTKDFTLIRNELYGE
jgi:hypothetical protein